MNVREKRLRADHDRIVNAFPVGSPIEVIKVFGEPPEKYHIRYRVKGLVLQAGTPVERLEHMVEVYLTQSYPRMAPQCRMLTPVFHPNIAPHAICIGDHWAAGESLADLIVRIGEMISFQSYNTKSPLNGDAARWADLNAGRLPVDATHFHAERVEAKLSADGKGVDGAICENCGSRQGIASCHAGHAACPNCLMECPLCRKQACAKCGFGACAVCKDQGCGTCLAKCANCDRPCCTKHRVACFVCGKAACPDCEVECGVCGKKVCLKDYVADKTRCRRCAGHITAMRVKATCVSCGGIFSIPHRLCGKTLPCPRCHASLRVPEVKPPAT
mgnify:CR=1 FL=1